MLLPLANDAVIEGGANDGRNALDVLRFQRVSGHSIRRGAIEFGGGSSEHWEFMFQAAIFHLVPRQERKAGKCRFLRGQGNNLRLKLRLIRPEKARTVIVKTNRARNKRFRSWFH